MFEPTTYEIVISGRAGAQLLRPLLDDFVCDHSVDGVTRLVGTVTDPAQLHGVVAHLTSMNAELISIARLDAAAAVATPTPPTSTTTQQEWTSTT